MLATLCCYSQAGRPWKNFPRRLSKSPLRRRLPDGAAAATRPVEKEESHFGIVPYSCED